MNTNLKNLFKLRNLTYSDLVNNLRVVCGGVYQLPNASDETTSVNNESSFNYWKNKMLLKYPNADVAIDSKNDWFDRVKIIDSSYEYDKRIYVSAK